MTSPLSNQAGPIWSAPQRIQINDKGWGLADPKRYLEGTSHADIKALQNSYDHLDKDNYGPVRARAYMKAMATASTGAWVATGDPRYYQNYEDNYVDGGKTRVFDAIPAEMHNNPVFKRLVTTNLGMMFEAFEFSKDTLQVGIHVIRYAAIGDSVTFSSPVWLHTDTEPLVFLNVIGESAGLVGGDSIIAHKKNEVSSVLHLAPFEGMLVTKKCMHAVTPMSAPRDSHCMGYRDILLTTVEEADEVVKSRMAESLAA